MFGTTCEGSHHGNKFVSLMEANCILLSKKKKKKKKEETKSNLEFFSTKTVTWSKKKST